MGKTSQPSIQPFPPSYQGWGHRGRKAQTSLSPATLSSFFGGILRHFQASRETWSLQHVLGLPWGLLPEGRALNTSPGRCPGGILTRCPSHLIWFSLKAELQQFNSELLLADIAPQPVSGRAQPSYGRSSFRPLLPLVLFKNTICVG